VQLFGFSSEFSAFLQAFFLCLNVVLIKNNRVSHRRRRLPLFCFLFRVCANCNKMSWQKVFARPKSVCHFVTCLHIVSLCEFGCIYVCVCARLQVCVGECEQNENVIAHKGRMERTWLALPEIKWCPNTSKAHEDGKSHRQAGNRGLREGFDGADRGWEGAKGCPEHRWGVALYWCIPASQDDNQSRTMSLVCQ